MSNAAQRGGGSTRARGPASGGLRNPGIQPVLWNLIRTYSQRLNLDPYAVAAVSRVEGGGRFGEVGDSGSSFGPFQLHVGGALPPGRDAAWANSAAGVWYAMQNMARSGAAGLRGLPAVTAIVTRFERPAAPGAEVTSAWSGYRSFGGPLPQQYTAQPPAGGVGFASALNPGGWQRLLQAQLAGQQAMAQQFKQSQAALLQQMASSAAQTRQQNLAASIAAQAQARVASGQAAQRSLSAGQPGVASSDPAAILSDQRRLALQEIHSQALRRAGILG